MCFDVILKCVLLLFIYIDFVLYENCMGFTHTKLTSKFLNIALFIQFGIGCESKELMTLCFQSIY